MATLSSAIVKQKVASMQDVEEALSRQVLYGGDLATNLLEAAAVDEAALTQVIAQSQGLEPAPAGELPRSPETVLRLVPKELSERHGVYPLAERDGQLLLAVSEPLPTEVAGDLGFLLGVTVAQYSAPLVRIRQALARDCGLRLDGRLERLLAKLAGRKGEAGSRSAAATRPGTASSMADSALEPTGQPVRLDAALLRPSSHAAGKPPGAPQSGPEHPKRWGDLRPRMAALQSGPSSAVFEGTATSPDGALSSASEDDSLRGDSPSADPSPLAQQPRVERVQKTTQLSAALPLPERPAAAPRDSAGVPALATLTRPSRPPGSLRAAPRRGPYTAAMAEQDLLEAESREDVLRALFDFSRQFFEYSALFAVHGDILEGCDAQGPGLSREYIVKIGVPLDLPGSASRSLQAGTFLLARLEDKGIDGQLARDLQRPTGKAVLFLPVVVRNRGVLMLLGDHGEDDVELSSVGEVIAFAPLVSHALERVILQRKLAARRAVARPSTVPPPRLKVTPTHQHQPLPDAQRRAEALAQALMSTPPRVAGPARASVLEQRPQRPSFGPVSHPEGPDTTRGELGGAENSEPTAASSPEPWQPNLPTFPAAPPSSEWEQASEPEVPRGDGDSPADSQTDGDHRPAADTRPQGDSPHGGAQDVALAAMDEAWDNAAAELAPAWEAPDAPGAAPDIAVSETALDEDFEEGAPSADGKAPLAPAQRSVHYRARRLQPGHQAEEHQLPSVIVDVEDDAQKLVDQLLAGNDAASQELVTLGESAVTALVSHFPGPIVEESRAGTRESQRPSRCGPVLNTLMRIGSAGVPQLVARTADPEPSVRVWATRLLGEIADPEGAAAIARRFADEDPEVRRAALMAGRWLSTKPAPSRALRSALIATATNGAWPGRTRFASIQALVDLRDSGAVPALIELLINDESGISSRAATALRVLAKQDFGSSPVHWQAWWERNAERHRVEWLIDSLMHEDAELRREAGDELKSITKEYFGYYDDLPRKERARAQKRYREWWEAEGRALFGVR